MTDTVTVVTNPSTNTVEIVSVGPQGPQGPQGVKGDVGDVNPDMITLRDAAAASASAAAGSASSASTSASTATTQASSASGSASTATSQATIATNQATTATTKAGEASTSATNAAASAGTASSSATTATTKASEASTSASNAAGSASTAISQAAIATTKAAEADASATAAAGSASSASTSAATASTQATNAANSQSTATSAAATATTQATNASTSAASATTKANDAANSAASVGTAAATASTQAGLAITSANSAAASASSVGTAAATATAKASEAAGSAAAINATFGNAASVALQAQNAQAAASLAQGYAASASSVVQQDLSGITAQALHRSPNAITAQFIYDTSKDSDGGAWTEKCQGTSWYNEALAGKWLGPQFTETFARYSGATVSTTELITNGDFSNGTTGWTANTYGASTISANNNVLRVTETGAAANAAAGQTFPVTSGKVYRVTFDVVYNTSNAGIGCWVGTSYGAANWLYSNNTYGYSFPGRSTFYFTAAGATAYFNLIGYFTAGGTSEYFEVANISVREVTALTTASNDYFQLTTDGKFYRLYKNLLLNTGTLTAAGGWSVSNATSVVGATDPNAGTSAYTFTATANNGYIFRQSNKAIAGLQHTNSIYVRRVSGSGAVTLYNDLGSEVAITLTTSWARYSTTWTATGVNGYCGIKLAVSGDVVEIWNPQEEIGNVATTYEAKAADASTSEIFRGNKADFPRLAAIVAEAGNVNIYDLTEPGRPMWMRFFGGNSSCVVRGNNLTCITSFGGFLYIGHGTSFGLAKVDFVNDKATLITTAGEFLPRNISNRNDTSFVFSTATNTTQGPSVVNAAINAVAMTVLPDAPIDPATGLRVPTIAVATGGGVSVIKHNGTVVNSSSTGAYTSIQLTPNALHTNSPGGGRVWNIAAPLATLGPSFALSGTLTDGAFTPPDNATIQTLVSSRSRLYRRESNQPRVRAMLMNEVATLKGLAFGISNTFNTGWLTGDIRRAYLSDVTAESISGSELVTNGTFATDVSGWTALNGGSIAWSSGAAVVTGAAASTTGVYQPITCVIGKTYRFQATCTLGTATVAEVAVNASAAGSGGSLGTTYGYLSSSQTFVAYFVATATTHSVVLMPRGVGLTATFDNVTVTEAVLDRSYKAASAPVFGTLTKSQLASGTSLVGYSGFSASNYLREPYSADLDFGTGEWNASAWVNVPVTLTDASFGATSVPTTLDTAEWTKGTGWSAPSANSFSCNGTQTTQTDLTWSSGNRTTSNSSIIRRWTVTVTAISGTLTVYPNNNSPFSVTTTGTYYGYSNPLAGETVAILRMNTAGHTCTGTLALDDLSPSAIVHRAHTSGPSFRLGINRIGLLTATAFDGTTTRTVTTTAAYNTATWLKAEASYTTDGSLTIRVNGREVAATRGNPLLTLNNTSAPLTIGNSYALDAPFPGSIALLKLGATVPTPEQATFMYEQEKQLFRANALSVMPDAGAVVDMAYDDATDRWVAVSAANESYWTGLIRNTVTPVPAGSYTKIVATSGIELAARSTTNPGVDVTIPAYGLREELVKRSEAAARLGKELATFDYVGGFTANTTNGNTAITSVSTITYPGSYIGARISGSGIPTNATIVAVSGTTLYISAAATATATTVQITFLDFALPAGMEAKTVFNAGVQAREGASAAFTRLYDGFIETIRFGAAPGYTALVTIQAQRISQ